MKGSAMKGGVLRGEVLRRGSAEGSVGAGDPTRLWCPQGTARIQLRCRAVSATVPSPWLVSLGVRCCFRFGPQSRAENAVRKARTGSQNGIKHVPGIPNKGSQNGQHVTKIGTRRPRWGQQCVPKRPKGGQNRDKRAKMGPESPRPGRRATLVRERGVSAMKPVVVSGGQKGQNLFKNDQTMFVFWDPSVLRF